MKDFEENMLVVGKVDNIMMELKFWIKDEDFFDKEIKFRVNKVKEWLIKMKFEEELDVLKDEENFFKDIEGKDVIVDLMKLGFVRLVVVFFFFKINLFVFYGDFCEWFNWYGMFKVLVYD